MSDWTPEYDRWRHGGWYVTNLHYPSLAVGCVSRNYEDGKWRIVCDPRPFDEAPTFKSRDEAARGERDLILAMPASDYAAEALAQLDQVQRDDGTVWLGAVDNARTILRRLRELGK